MCRGDVLDDTERPDGAGAAGGAGVAGGDGGDGTTVTDQAGAAVADPVPEGESVVAIVAAKDAAATVAATVEGLLRLASVDEVMVVDDGSSDDTATQARRAGAWVLHLPVNRGKGGAVAAGVGLAPHARAYLLIDADVGATAVEAAPLLDPVLDGRADMTVGVLPSAGKKGGFGGVKRLAALGIRLGTRPRRRVTAPLSGQRAVRGDLLRSLTLAPRFGLETALTIDAVRAGGRVLEIPVAMDHRHTGRRLAGFVHRGRQGVDIVRALWPRITTPGGRTRLIATGLLLVLLAALWSGGQWEPSSVALAERPQRVLIVGVPGLEWDEIGTGRLPNLDRVVADGALAAMTVRTLSSEPTTVEAYASLGAGARVRAGALAEDAVGAGGPIEVREPDAVRRDAGKYVPARPGALGDALHAAGLRTAVVGNADTPRDLVGLSGLISTRRPVAAALMDSAGHIDTGSVELSDLLLTDRRAPFSMRADPARMLERTVQALQAADVVLVDAGDLDRAADLRGIAPALFADQYRERALDLTDRLLGRIMDMAPPGTMVIVASVVPPEDEWRLTPVVASGPGVARGYLHSPSTRRLGLVTLTDLAPTVLAALDVPVPGEMIGHALRYHPGTPAPGRLARLDREIAFRERIYLGVTLVFIAFQAAVYGLIGWMLSRTRPHRLAWVVRDLVVAIAAFPLGTLLFRAVTPFAPGLGTWGVVLLPVVIVGVVLLARQARGSPLAPLGWVFGVTVAVLVLDVATGGRLQVGGLLGYSPQSAGRFYGLGNTTFAVLAACTLLAAALHLARAPRRRDALVAVAALFVLVIVVDGAPNLGDDVGGILTLVPVLGLALIAFAGKRLTWRTVLLAGLAAVAVVAVATGIDLLRAPESRTHLGRLAADTWRDGGDELLLTMRRKWAANMRLLRLTPWAWAVPVIAGFLLYVLFARKRWNDLLPPRSVLRTGVLATLAAGILGFAVNDSGVVVTALVLVEVGPLLALLCLAEPPPLDRPILLEPATDAPSRPHLAARRP